MSASPASSTPEIVPGDPHVTSLEYDALRRDIRTLGEYMLVDREERKASDAKLIASLDGFRGEVKGEIEGLRQDLAVRDHRIAETTLRLHRSSTANQEILKEALETLDDRMAARHAEDQEWKERFKTRVLDLQGKAVEREAESDLLAVPGLRPSWALWQRGIALGLLVLAAGLSGSALTACAAREGLLESRPDATPTLETSR